MTKVRCFWGGLVFAVALLQRGQVRGEDAYAPDPLSSIEPPSTFVSDSGEASKEERPREMGQRPHWLENISLPDFPVRWDPQVVRFLGTFRDEPQMHQLMEAWLTRAQSYAPMIRAECREGGVPEDLLYVAMIESGFDPSARSPVGALGLWQFVTSTGKLYGLKISHWLDERKDPQKATRAAIKHLKELHERLGSWELALAAYNMGPAALLKAIRKYNTNDFWILTGLEAGVPYETSQYVARIMSAAVVGRNPDRFRFASWENFSRTGPEIVQVPGGTPLDILARAADVDVNALGSLNNELRRKWTPPDSPTYDLKVPSAEVFLKNWQRLRPNRPAFKPYIARFGESLDEIASRFHTTASALRRVNEMDAQTPVRVGFALLVPAVIPQEAPPKDLVTVVVPPTQFDFPERRRVFYRPVGNETLAEVSKHFGVLEREVCEWNQLDPQAVLQPGMMLQLFVPKEVDLSGMVVFGEEQVRVLVVGTDEFFDHYEGERGRVRVRYSVKTGDTLPSIARHFNLTVGDLTRINRFSPKRKLEVGEEIVVYTASSSNTTVASESPTQAVDEKNPLPESMPAAEVKETLPDTAETPSTAPREHQGTDVSRDSSPPSAEPAAPGATL